MLHIKLKWILEVTVEKKPVWRFLYVSIHKQKWKLAWIPKKYMRLSQAFFCTLSKKLKKFGPWKKLSQILPKNSTYRRLFFTKKLQKNSLYEKTGIFAPKTQFFPFKTQCTAGLRPELSCRKVYKKKPDIDSEQVTSKKQVTFWKEISTKKIEHVTD